MLQGGVGRGLGNTDVVNDAAKSACVRVEGSLNGQPFIVERTVARCAAAGPQVMMNPGEQRFTR